MNRPYRDDELALVSEIAELMRWSTKNLICGDLGASQCFLAQAVEKHKALCDKVEENDE